MTDVREDFLQNLLQKIAAEQKYDNPDIRTKVVPTTGRNFSSQLFHGTIKSTDKEELNVFAKVAVIGGNMREQSGMLDFYKVEPYFYTKLGKAYKEIEEKYSVPEKYRLVVPKFYGHSAEYLKEVLVLQDMSKDGFVTYDRVKSIDWEYASTAIEEMAKFHALSIAFQKENPEEYEEAKKVCKRPMENTAMEDMYRKGIEQMIQITREENRLKVQNFFHGTLNLESVIKFYKPKKRPVMTHSDFRTSNLMHRIDENGKLQVVIVDYQTLHAGSAIIDLLYFIFTGSDGAFREKYYDQLIEHYYENLAAALRRLDLDPEEAFPRRDFDEELKEVLPFGLMISFMILPIITVDLADVKTSSDGAFESDDMEDMAAFMRNANALCAERINEVVDDYVKWGVI